MQLHKGQTRAKPHGPALLQPDEPRTQFKPHNITVPGQEPPPKRRQPRPPPPRTTHCLSHTLHCAVVKVNPLFIVIW